MQRASVVAWFFCAAAWAQDPFEVEPVASGRIGNLVAPRLAGVWQLDAGLTQRLQGRTVGEAEAARDAVEIRADPAALRRIPAPVCARILGEWPGLRIFFAGVLVHEKGEAVCFLLQQDGNLLLAFCRDRDGAIIDFDAKVVRLAPAQDPKDDLLFFGESSAKAYARSAASAPKVAGKPVEAVMAALTEMERMLQQKDYVALIERFATPAEVQAMRAREGGIAAVADKFASKDAEKLMAAVRQAMVMQPKLEQEGQRVTFAVENGRPLVFQLVDGRWYLK